MARTDHRETVANRHDSIARREGLNVGIICLILAAIVWIAFGQTIDHEFLNYDDNEYVYENPNVSRGLSLDGIGWAFTHTYSANWHPLTTISHMLDCQFYGLQPWGHHLTNVLLHAAATILLFLAFRKLTGSIWPSAFVAALFAIHPLRTESVAWIAERKDVLSGLFFALTLLAYAGYARSKPGSTGKYVLVLVLFGLGLLCKPTLVTVPFVLLLLDYWPLGRFDAFRWSRARALLIEKIPFFIFSAGACMATVLAQTEALEATRRLTLAERASNVLISYLIYLGQLFYPRHLAVFYPYLTDVNLLSQLIPALVLVTVVSIGFLYWRKSYPFFLVGWLWFLGMLVPMIGLIQVGSQAHADRYTYLSQIGLYLAVVWGAIALFARSPRAAKVLISIGLLIVTGLTARSYQETSFWRTSETLWRHALENTSNNYVAHNNLGHVLTEKGQFAEAIGHFRQAVQIKPDYAEAWNNLGNALLDSDESTRRQKPLDLEHPENNDKPNGALDEAIDDYKKALQSKPTFAEGWTNLGTALLQKGQLDEAVTNYQKALELEPDLPEANGNYANALLQKGEPATAIGYYSKAINLKPDYADAHYGVSKALLQTGKPSEAREHLEEVLKLRPDYPEAHHNLGVILAQNGQLDPAIAEYRKAIELRHNYAQAENNLGNALLRKGRTDDAIEHLENALKIDPNYPEACNDLGSAFMAKNEIEDAIKQYRKAVTIKQDYAEAHSNLGNAYLQNRELDEAIAQDKAAVMFKPDSAPMQYNLGNALVAKGNFAEAVIAYQAAVQAQPNYAEVHNKLGVALAALHKNDEAIQEFENALQLNPRYADAHYNLGHLLAHLGRTNDAVAHLSEALRLKPDYVLAKQQLNELSALPH